MTKNLCLIISEDWIESKSTWLLGAQVAHRNEVPSSLPRLCRWAGTGSALLRLARRGFWVIHPWTLLHIGWRSAGFFQSGSGERMGQVYKKSTFLSAEDCWNQEKLLDFITFYRDESSQFLKLNGEDYLSWDFRKRSSTRNVMTTLNVP